MRTQNGKLPVWKTVICFLMIIFISSAEDCGQKASYSRPRTNSERPKRHHLVFLDCDMEEVRGRHQ